MLRRITLSSPMLALFLAGLPSASAAQEITVPSGQPVEFTEMIRDIQGPQGLTLRFRFVAPQISRENGSIGFAEASADMEYLCNSFAIPRIASPGPKPAQIIISMSDQPVEFGQATPEITQFFEAYAIQGDSCIWEGF